MSFVDGPAPEPEMTPERLAEVRERAARTAADEWLLSDCEGDLRIWRVSALAHVTRDQATGEVTGFSEPSSYRASDEILAIELDSWDPGEDATDDQRRTDIGDMFEARAAEPALLADNARLRARVAELEALAAAAVEYRVECPDAGLAVRQQVGGVRWAVLDGARSALLPTGWVPPDAIHGDDGPFCWPDAVTAIAEARRALAEGGDSRG